MKWKKAVLKEGNKDAPTKPKGRPKKNSIPSLSEIIAGKTSTFNNGSICEIESDSDDDSDNFDVSVTDCSTSDEKIFTVDCND